MCTVTFVPTKNGICITSNRDEKVSRKKAISPQKTTINNKEITYPKDPQAGGTWFAHDNENVIVLLNGAQEKHISKENYRKSRGLIVLDLISTEDVLSAWKSINLLNIEPFTLVFFNGNQLFQLQWNEVKKSTLELNKLQNYIWSSSTLYSKEIRKERENWFTHFIETTKEITAKDLLHFHQFTENENTNYGLQINRNNILKTVSITQCTINKTIDLKYIDLLEI